MPDPLWINASAGAPSYDAAELRRLMALPIQYNGRTLGARAGVRPGGNALQTSIAGSTITVRAGCAYVDPALTTTQGGYWTNIATDETHTLTAAHATNPRKDITILRVYDHDEDGSGLRNARTEYIAGVASGTPAEPAVPAGSFKLSTIDVPSVANGGPPVVTINNPFVVATGGLLPVRTEAERTALTPFDGEAIYRMDRDWVEVYDGAAWRVVGVAHCSSTGDRDSAITSPYNGQLASVTDGNLYVRVSGAWVSLANPFWVAYSPTWTIQALGSSTTTGSRYRKVGRHVEVVAILTAGTGASLGTSNISVSLPFAAANITPNMLWRGVGTLRDQLAGTIYDIRTVIINNETTASLWSTNASAGTASAANAFVTPGTAGYPFTVSPASIMTVHLFYESAS